MGLKWGGNGSKGGEGGVRSKNGQHFYMTNFLSTTTLTQGSKSKDGFGFFCNTFISFPNSNLQISWAPLWSRVIAKQKVLKKRCSGLPNFGLLFLN